MKPFRLHNRWRIFEKKGDFVLKYIDLVRKLQKEEKNDGYIVIIKSGIFFIGLGKDAIILNKLLNLKLICMREGLCKVGFQI